MSRFPGNALPPKLENPLRIPEVDGYLVRARIGFAEAADLAKRAIVERALRPADLGDPDRDAPRLGWVPFWRVDASVDGFHLGLSGVRVGNVPLPTGGTKHKDAVLLVCARRAFPYELGLPSWLSGVVGDTEPIELDLAELESLATHTPEGGELVDADVSREARSETRRPCSHARSPPKARSTSTRSNAFVRRSS